MRGGERGDDFKLWVGLGEIPSPRQAAPTCGMGDGVAQTDAAGVPERGLGPGLPPGWQGPWLPMMPFRGDQLWDLPLELLEWDSEAQGQILEAVQRETLDKLNLAEFNRAKHYANGQREDPRGPGVPLPPRLL